MAPATPSPTLGDLELIDDQLPRPVALVEWPDDDLRRIDLAQRGEPRLLVLATDTPPPLTWDDREDWVRRPADRDDLVARALNLLRHAPAARVTPVLDTDGIVRLGEHWAALPPVEARMFALLVNRMGEVVPKGQLVDAGWPDGIDDSGIIYGRMRMLRRRLVPLGLRIETIRGVGFLLDHA